VTSFALWLVGLGGRSTSLLLTTLSVVIIARALGPAGRGQYFLFISFVLVLAALADLGLSQSAAVFSGRGTPLRQLHRVLLELAPATSLAVAAVATFLFPLLADRVLVGLPAEWYFVGLALLPLCVYANLWTGMMIGARRIVETNAVQLAMNALTLVANLAFVATTGNPAAAVVVYAALLAVQAVTMFVVLWRIASASPEPPEASRKGSRLEMLGFGLRGYPGSLSTLVWSRAAVFVLNTFHGPASVGVFSVAQQLAEKTLFPIQAMQDLIYSRMAQLSRVEATTVLNRFLRVTVAATVPTVVLLIMAVPALVTFLFSEQFDESVDSLRLLLVGSAVQSVPMILAPYFLAQLRRPGLLSVLGWANAALNLLLLLALVPASAEIGAAAAMVTTQAIGTAVVFGLYVHLGRTDPASALMLRVDDIALVEQQTRRLIRR
jgi:O-antigen/teichoic acid export membrane protein